jgi:hypothetical protein
VTLVSSVLPESRIIREVLVSQGGRGFERHHVSDHLALGVQHRAAIPPLPICETHVLPNAHFSVQLHRPLLPNTENGENRGETLERTLARIVVALQSQWLRKEMAPQVGFEPHPEIPTAARIVLKFAKNTRKTSIDAGFEGVFDLSLKAGKTCQVGGRQYKSSTFLGARKIAYRLAANPADLCEPFVRRPAQGSIQSGWFHMCIQRH